MLENIISKFKNDVDFIKTIFISSLSVFLISYLHALTHEIAIHDNLWIETLGATFESGRFSIAIIYQFFKYLLGGRLIATPVMNGIITFIFINMTTYYVVKILDIKNKIFVIFISFIMIANPIVASFLAIRSAAIIYSLSLLMGTYAVYLYAKKNVNIFIPAIITAFAIGIYQAFVAFYVSLCLLYIIKVSFENKYNIKETIKLIFKYIILYVLSLLIYFSLLYISLLLSHEHLSNYKNANEIISANIFDYINRILLTYKYYFNLKGAAPFFAFNTHILYYALFFISIILLILNKTKLSSGTIFSILLFHIAVHSNVVLFGVGNYHYNMMGYSIVFQFIILFYFIDAKYESIKKSKFNTVVFISYIFIIFSNIYLSNLSSLKAEFVQSQAKTYFTNLIQRIESTDGYKPDMNVCFVNELKKNTIGYNESFKEFDSIKYYVYIYGLDFDDVINNYAWRRFMWLWNGYKPHVLPDDEYKDIHEVKNMPSYPQNGSIKIIDNVIVVKFAPYD